MGVGYLDNNFLAELGDDDLGAEMATTPLTPVPGDPGYQPPDEMITLPGGVVMPKKTFYIVIAVIVALAIYFYRKNQKAKEQDEE